MTSQQQRATPGPDQPAVEPSLPHWIVARAASFLEVLGQVRKIARFNSTVMIEGETGVGKELVVRLLHYLSPRAGGPFIPVNVGAIQDSLFEDELFGHVAGAYTGARGSSDGLIALADGGTLFLDEIDALSPHGQAALLRFLQDHSYRALGGRTLKQADVRIITATNADPLDLMQRGLLRKDLYFRLSAVHVKVPPLRERRDDIVPLARHFLAEFNALSPDYPRRILGERLQAHLLDQRWPGNIRELRSVIERCFILSEGPELTLPETELSNSPLPPAACFREAKARVVAQFEHGFLDRLLRDSAGNISQAARAAGKERKSLERLLRKHGIEASAYRPGPVLGGIRPAP